MGKVIVEKKGPIAIIKLNSPETLNALNTEFLTEIDGALDQVDEDKSIFVAIITGTEKAFIAGADIKYMMKLTAVEILEWAQFPGQVISRIEGLRIPVIAAIDGFALGGGCEFCMGCDIRIASTRAKFGQPEVSLGIIPGSGGTQRLPRLVGEGRAKELVYTGKIINAQEAERIGLVNKVVPPESLLDEAMAMAEQICAHAQIAVQQCKRAINAGMQADLKTALDLELQAFSICSSTEDKQIGMGAFINKSKEKKFIYR
jgi:enoyl-CoA hydratase